MAEILIVDDEEKIGKLLCAELSDAGHVASHESDPAAALNRIRAGAPDIVVTDLRMPEVDGLSLLRETRRVSPGTDVVIMTAYASLDTALEALRAGAYDYVIKPFRTETLMQIVARIDEKRRLVSENSGLREYTARATSDEIIGVSASVQQVRDIIRDLGNSDAAVLIRGESGTGKELVARAVHRASRRSGGAFIALNCAAIPETLLESELFGYEKGAFTGATRKKMGHFQLADGGTLFLDEIGDLPASLQAKLLRVLENQRVQPLGSERDVQVNVRLISATHRSLEAAISEGRFREDLFYRLNVFPISLAPLRERRDDIRPLAEHFLSLWGRRGADVSSAAAARLGAYHWPGNIRELRNVLERATILCPTGTILEKHILISDAPGGGVATGSSPATLNLAEMEQELIRRAIDVTAGNKSEAARLLGVTRRALYGRLERYGMLGDDADTD